MTASVIRSGFVTAGLPAPIIDAILKSYEEAKRRVHLGDHMPSAVEGGRFSEAVLRLIEFAIDGSFTPFGDSKFKTDPIIKRAENAVKLEDSLRFHIPRSLRVIYDVRNKRDTGHLGDGSINPNLMDTTLVVGVMDWVLAELVRIYHSVDPSTAQALIDGLVTREVPTIEEIAEHPVLNKDLARGDHIVVLLYRAGTQEGLSVKELMEQMEVSHRANTIKAIKTLVGKKRVWMNTQTDRVHITSVGLKYVEHSDLLSPA